MPKDIRSFFKPAPKAEVTSVEETKIDKFLAKNDTSKSKLAKQSDKGQDKPKDICASPPTKSRDEERSKSSVPGKKSGSHKKGAKMAAAKIIIDDDSDEDIIKSTPPKKSKSKVERADKSRKKSRVIIDSCDSDVEVAEVEVAVVEVADVEIEEKRKQRKRGALTKMSSSTDELRDQSEFESLKTKGKRKKEYSDDDDVSPKPKLTKGERVKKKGMTIDSDSDEDLKPIEKKPRKPRKKKEEAPIIGVSDEDIPQSPRPLEAAFARAPLPMSPARPITAVKKTPEENKAKKAISVVDFFGSGEVHRSSRTPTSSKRKSEVIELHDDDEFEQALAQIDLEELEQPAKKVKLADSNGRDTVDGASLAEKIAEKAKVEKALVDKAKSMLPIPGTKTPQKASNTPKITPSKVLSATKSAATPSTSKGGSTPSAEAKRTGFLSFVNRAGPTALGSKEIPTGAPNCLEGVTFVITGVQESIERDDLKELIERHGGRVTTSLGKRTRYVVVGRDAGESKLQKAAQYGTKQLDEDGVFALIRSAPGKESKYEIEARKTAEAEEAEARKAAKSKVAAAAASPLSRTKANPGAHVESVQASVCRTPPASEGSQRLTDSQYSTPRQSQTTTQSNTQESESSQLTASPQVTDSAECLMWVDKYKPKSLKNIIGQQGDKSQARKLSIWLRNWHQNVRAGRKPNFVNRWNDDGGGYRAALLSGPPGVGKTTTAALVCREVGFTFIEMNASDARNKKSLEGQVSEMLKSRSLDKVFGVAAVSQAQPRAPTHCLIMDEVDGMAGNEDRGGMAELIQLIKKSCIPVICICNDRQHLKMRALANYCFDLRFQRPRVEQIKSAMMSIAYKEGLKLSPPVMNEIILAANQDVRQVIHNLSMWSASDKALSFDQTKKDAKDAQKDIKINVFDVCRKVFSAGEETAKMTLHDKSDLFFHDYNMLPIFVQENYVHVQPGAARGDVHKHMTLLSEAADSIAAGDVVSRKIWSTQDWGLLPLQAIFSSVIPGELMRGSMGAQIAFPACLGKLSSSSKVKRTLDALNTHMHLKVSCDRNGLNLDYRTYLRNALHRPLLIEDGSGVNEVIKILDEYSLQKDDFESIMEISQWPNQKDPMSQVASKTKAAFTRTYNKTSHMLPYASASVVKKTKRSASGAGDEENVGEGEDGMYAVATEDSDQQESDDDIANNPMIKAVQPKTRKAEPKPRKAEPKPRKAEPKPRKAEPKKTDEPNKGKGRGKKS